MRLATRSACALLGVVSACAGDLPAYNEVHGLRVLAVSATPPWVPAGQPSALATLVAGAEDATYRWRWCPVPTRADDGHACPLEAQADLPSLALGEGPEAKLPAFTQDALRRLCALQGQATCEAAEVEIALTVAAAGDQIEARRTVTLMAASEPGPTNPEIVEVELRTEALQTALSTAGLALPASAEAQLRLEAAGATEGAMTVSWFVTGGELAFARTRPEPTGPENTWTLPDQPGLARLYVVLRTAEGGTTWRTFEVEVEAP